MKQIRMRISVAGAHLGNPEGSKVGDILTVEDGVADRYVNQGYATLVVRPSPKEETEETKEEETKEVETAVAAPPAETAALDTEAQKRGPGRPRKEA